MLGLIASKVVDFELELELEAMKIAVAELRPKVVEGELVLESAATLVGVPVADAVAESMTAVVGVPIEPAEPKEVVLEVCAVVVAPMEVGGVTVTGVAVSMEPGAALVGLEVDPKAAVFDARLVIHECVPKLAGLAFALEVDSMVTDFERSRYL